MSWASNLPSNEWPKVSRRSVASCGAGRPDPDGSAGRRRLSALKGDLPAVRQVGGWQIQPVRNAPQVSTVAEWAAEHKVDLRTVELDVRFDASAEAGIARIIAEAGRLDVIISGPSVGVSTALM